LFSNPDNPLTSLHARLLFRFSKAVLAWENLMLLSLAPDQAATSPRSAPAPRAENRLVEKDKEVGGTCLNVGCIPSKALLSSSDHFMFVKKEAAKHGIVIEGAHADLAKMQERENRVVKTFNSGVRSLIMLDVGDPAVAC
jgi:hypothetical protein